MEPKEEDKDKFKEEYKQEQETLIKKEWGEFEEEKEKKEEKKKEITPLVLRDDYKELIVIWNQVAKKYDKEIESALFNLFGKDGLTGLGRKITDEFIDSDYKEIEEAQDAVTFIRDSRRLWVRINRRHKEFKEMISRLFESNHNCLQMIKKLREEIKGFEEKESKGEEKEQEPPAITNLSQQDLEEVYRAFGDQINYVKFFRDRRYRLYFDKMREIHATLKLYQIPKSPGRPPKREK